MNKNIYIKSIFFSLIMMLFSSCEEDWLDVNKDPNRATSTSPEYLFSYATVSWSGNRLGGDGYLPIGFMNQTISTGGNVGWGELNPYDISPYSLGNAWKMYYATTGANLVRAIDLAKIDKTPNKEAQAKIILSALMYECTMTYGDIPFSEAWREEINDPKFDAQKDVLENLITQLEEAISLIDVNDSEKISTEDLYFEGDLEKWKVYANSLIFKIAITMVDSDPSKKEVIAKVIKRNLMTEPSNNVEFPFFDTPGNYNPFYRILNKYNNNVNDWFYANTTVLEGLMKPNNDPRISKYYTKGSKATEFVGVKTDDAAIKDISAVISTENIIKADASDVLMTSQEINLLLAEVYARGLGVSVDINKAQQYFNKGLRQSLVYNNVDNKDIDDFINNNKFNLSSNGDPVKVIHEQQYVDLVNRPLEAWIQVRRSGPKGQEVPNLPTPRLAPIPNGEIARRWIYPPDELTGNVNAPNEIPKIWESMWFDK